MSAVLLPLSQWRDVFFLSSAMYFISSEMSSLWPSVQAVVEKPWKLQ